MSILQGSSIPTSSNKKASRVAIFFATLVSVLAVAFVAALLLGSAKIDMWQTVCSLFKGDLSDPNLKILIHVRLPRVLAAIFAGSALAVSGVIIQAVLQNPMAAPNIIGVNSGAGFCAVFLMSVVPAAVAFVPIAAFLGALGASLLIYAISHRSGAGRLTVTLVGIAVGSILSAGISALKMIFPDSVYDAESFTVGGLSGVGFSKLYLAAVIIILGLLLALIFCRGLDILSLGADSAAGLGMNVRRARFFYILLASALAGAAVSFAGLIGFVGLVVPHIARRFVGNSHRHLVLSSALGGAFLVLVCDLFARVAFSPYELSVGIILSLIGGPFFVALVLTQKRRFD